GVLCKPRPPVVSRIKPMAVAMTSIGHASNKGSSAFLDLCHSYLAQYPDDEVVFHAFGQHPGLESLSQDPPPCPLVYHPPMSQELLDLH
ncbi:unnamed protein product, partial [Chrysoparadoxa australica]